MFTYNKSYILLKITSFTYFKSRLGSIDGVAIYCRLYSLGFKSWQGQEIIISKSPTGSGPTQTIIQ
jgi:hypothetical protein